MKRTHLAFVTVLSVAMVFACGLASASAATDVVTARKALKNVSAIELPSKAAEMVFQSTPVDRAATATAVVSAALDLRPTAAMAVVGAIAKQSPAAAAPAARKAASMQPKNLAEIAAAAAAAAPKQAGEIVEALCKAMPTKYVTIASAVAKVVPSASQEIVAAVISAVPSLKPFVDKASNEVGGKDASVDLLMARTEAWVVAVAQATRTPRERVVTGPTTPIPPGMAPPTPGPPYTPLPDNAVVVTIRGRNTTNAPPGGGRDYSAP